MTADSSAPKKSIGKVRILFSFILGTVTAGVFFSQLSNSSSEVIQSSTKAPRTESETQTIDTYRRVNGAVVNVSTQVPTEEFFGPSYQQGSGSGIIVDAKSGYVFTNFHVVEGAARSEQIVVTLSSGQAHRVKIIGQDPDNDLALLQIIDIPQDLVAIEFGDSNQLEVGQRVLAIGNPFGLERTLTEGIVSSLGRTIRAESGRLIENVIQTDAAINPGNSGGPLLDVSGRLVGMNSAIVSSSGQSAGIGFAIPVDTLRKALPLLVQYGRVPRPKIGAWIGETPYGPVMLYVQPGGPSEQAGLSGARKCARQGLLYGCFNDLAEADFILSVNGKEVASKADVLDELSKIEDAKPVELLVRHGLNRSRPRLVKVKPVLG